MTAEIIICLFSCHFPALVSYLIYQSKARRNLDPLQTSSSSQVSASLFALHLSLFSFLPPFLISSHSTAKDKGEKKLFGFAFTPLMREDGTTLSDESHEIYVYKVRHDCPVTLCLRVFLSVR